MVNRKHTQIIKLINKASNDLDIAEALGASFVDKIQTDCMSFGDIGRNLWQAYIKDPEVVDKVLIALSGWSMESLLRYAGIIDREEDSGELFLV